MKQEIVKGAQLTAINICKMRRTGEESLTIGKVYEVLGVNYNEDEFWIKDDFNEEHFYDISDYTDFFESLNSKSNNGWIKIESEDDLPNTGIYWVIRKGYETPMRAKIDINDNFYKAVWRAVYTNYQPIETPKPPIY